MSYSPNNPNGQATMANSAPVAIASNQSGIPADSDYLTVTGSGGALNADAVAATDVSKYRWVTVVVAGTFSATVTFQVSNDNSTWAAEILSRTDSSSAMSTTSSTSGTVFSGPLHGKYFRVRVTSYTSGTVTGDAFFSSLPGQVTDIRRIEAIVPGTAAGNLGKAEDASHASGDTGIATWSVANEAQTSFAADGDYIPKATDVKGNSMTVGNVAHDGVDAAFPVKVGGQARTTNPTAVADADRSNFITDKLGKQVVVGSVRDLKVQQNTTITSSTSETTVLTAGASGVFHDVYGVIVANTSATACEVTFKDATAGTTRFPIYVPAGDTRGFMLPESAAHSQATAANNWTATCGTSVASIKITVFAVKNT